VTRSGESNSDGAQPTSPQEWRDIREEFQTLANKDSSLHAYGAFEVDLFGFTIFSGEDLEKDARWACLRYDEHPGTMRVEKPKPASSECGLWMLLGRFDDNFLSQFRLSATSAGIALGSPKGTKPLVFWLHRIFIDWRENKSHLDRIADNGRAVIIPALNPSTVVDPNVRLSAIPFRLCWQTD
jgi:hypothetical protein